MSERPLHERVALVTGAGTGIGHAISLALAGHGARVVAAARTPAAIEAVAREIEAAGGEALAVPCDVRKLSLVETLVRTCVQRFDRLDIVVNNAGAFQIRPLEDTDEELWDSIVDTNLKGAYLVTRAALPHLQSSRGHVVNIGSTAARTTYAGSSAYCASKWGLMGFSGALRQELAPLGIRVTVVNPGDVDTPLWDSIPGDWDRASMMQPQQVAAAVVHALTQPAGVATDEIIVTPQSDT